MIRAAADGSSLNNPGPAGWAWYIDEESWAADGWRDGTNNQGELKAVLNLLQASAHINEPLIVVCDSQYVINTVTKWMPGWQRRGWKKADGKPVQNVEIIKAIAQAIAGRDVTFEWVKGHSGHGLNEAADSRARAAAEAVQNGEPVDCGPGFNVMANTLDIASQLDDQPDLFTTAEMPKTESNSLAKQRKAEMKVTFIGCGNIAEAMIAGVVKSGVIKPEQISVNALSQSSMNRLTQQFQVVSQPDKAQAVNGADLVILAVKPADYPKVIAEIADHLGSDTVVVDIAPGYPMARIRDQIDSRATVVHAMPNTTSRVGAGVVGLSFPTQCPKAHRDKVIKFFESFASVFEVLESELAAITAMAGSGVTIGYAVIEAMAMGGAEQGLEIAEAYRLAAASLAGSAKMVAETNDNCAGLRDAVCTPAGTTIAGVIEMEKTGLKADIIETMRAIVERYRQAK